MPRWSPDAALRLERSALELFGTQGYQATTIPQIAESAGLTTRTFFRHFADKRDVLFLREREFPQVVTASLAAAPPSMPPVELVKLGLRSAAVELQPLGRPIARRQAIIRQEPQLRERELLQYDRLADAIRDALSARSARPRTALVLSKLATVAFALSLGEWLDDTSTSLPALLDATLSEVLDHGSIGSDPASRRS